MNAQSYKLFDDVDVQTTRLTELCTKSAKVSSDIITLIMDDYSPAEGVLILSMLTGAILETLNRPMGDVEAQRAIAFGWATSRVVKP